jgi:hypothetical protein
LIPSIARELALSGMVVFAVRIELANPVPVQRQHEPTRGILERDQPAAVRQRARIVKLALLVQLTPAAASSSKSALRATILRFSIGQRPLHASALFANERVVSVDLSGESRPAK